jgi:hypothetical protein
MTDIRDLTPNSSLLTFLRVGGVLRISDYQIRGVQANQVIAVYKDNTLLHSGEYEFSKAGLFLALRHVIESE